MVGGCTRSQDKISPTAILISNANVLDVRTGKIMEAYQIVIDSGKVQQLTATLKNPEAYAVQIDGRGKYVLPGFAEMHAHIPPPDTGAERIEETLFLYLANGITTIRGMLGDPAHLQLRERAEKGKLLAPRIFTSSPSLNGNSVTNIEEAIQKVTAYQLQGYDFLKIHPGIQRDVFDQVVKTANEVGIPFAGHVPVAVGIRHALESKYASIDHIDGFLEGLVPDTVGVDPAQNGFFGYNFTHLADTTKIDVLVEMAKQNQVWIVPTQSLFERWFAPISAEELLTQPEMKYMPVSTLENWKQRKIEASGTDADFDKVQWQRFDAIRKQLLKKLHKNGHGILLGSDAPQIFNVPGFSIHHEMEGMLNAGLSPLEVIRAGTLNSAIYFNREGSLGEIKEGFDADLIMVDANPLENIKALQQISGVMRQGKWLSKAFIDKKLSEIAAHALQN
tara:strand:- start:281 stop:1624 length:1344 start_codon:yes stop_codon:yes gene_type:complete